MKTILLITSAAVAMASGSILAEHAGWQASQAIIYSGKTLMVGGGGTDAFATIAQAVAKLQPGDTLTIAPGVYHESIQIPCDNVAIVAAGPGVVLDGSVTLGASDFAPVEGRPGVFVWKLPARAPTGKESRTPWIWLGEQKLIPSFVPLATQKDQMAFYIDEAAKTLEVNIDGKSMPADAKFVVPVEEFLVNADGRKNVTVRGLELTRSASYAISGEDGEALHVEFCKIEWIGDGISVPSNSYIAGNTIRFANGNGIHQSKSYDCVIAENLVVGTRICWDGLQRWAGTIKANTSSRNLYRENWIMDQVNIGGKTKVGHREIIRGSMFASGLWPDINCFENAYFNNAIARMGHAGIYIEFTANRNTVQFNAIQDCAMGITVRQGSANIIARNWVFTNDYLGWGAVDTTEYCSYGSGFSKTGEPVKTPEQSPVWGKQYLEGLCLWHAYDSFHDKSKDNAYIGNLIQVSARAVSVPVARATKAKEEFKQNELGLVVMDRRMQYEAVALPDIKAATTVAPVPSPFDNRLDGNFYDRPADDKDFAWLGDKVAGNFQDYRQQTAWDGGGQVGRFTTKAIRLEPLWTIPAGAMKDQPVAILYDPTLQTSSAGDFRVPMLWEGSHVQLDYVAPKPPVTYWAQNTKGGDMETGRRGKWCLNLKNATTFDAKPVTQSATWQTVRLPVRAGLTFELDMWMRSQDVKPGQQGGTSVRIVFYDACGFEVGQNVVIGKGAHEELAGGSFDWTNVVSTAKAPANAAWMRVILTLPPVEGKVSFDEVKIGMIDPVSPSFETRK